MKCKICKKKPSEIIEYKYNPEGMKPDEFVRECEGTYDKRTETFLCTNCYVSEYIKGNVR